MTAEAKQASNRLVLLGTVDLPANQFELVSQRGRSVACSRIVSVVALQLLVRCRLTVVRYDRPGALVRSHLRTSMG